jgi:2'-5' RNA ligase
MQPYPSGLKHVIVKDMQIRKKLFIGLGIPAPLAKVIGRVLRPIIDPDQKGVVTPENYHVTLLDLGFVNEDELPSIFEAMESVTLDLLPIESHFTAIERFDAAHQKNSLALVGDPSDTLLAAHNAIGHALGYRFPDRKSFRPHVTLAHLRTTALLPGAEEALPRKVNFEESFDYVHVYESTLVDGRHVYLPLASYELLDPESKV